jgi:sugar O-acyltransferase (sialic acid O-acetyltransferase NeuD family)
MVKKIILAGSGGHAKVLRKILEETDLSITYLVTKDEDHENIKKHFSIEEIINDKDILNFDYNEVEIINGIGSVPPKKNRITFFNKFSEKRFSFKTLVSKHAFVSEDSVIEEGVQILPGAVIQAGVTIGKNTIINTGALIDHDCSIGKNNHIAPGAVLSGNVKTDNGVHVGTNASIIQGIRIGENSIVGAGVCAVRDIPKGHTLFPAKSTLLKNQ